MMWVHLSKSRHISMNRVCSHRFIATQEDIDQQRIGACVSTFKSRHISMNSVCSHSFIATSDIKCRKTA